MISRTAVFRHGNVAVTVRASNIAQQIVNTATVHTFLQQEDSNTANNSTTVSVTTN